MSHEKCALPLTRMPACSLYTGGLATLAAVMRREPGGGWGLRTQRKALSLMMDLLSLDDSAAHRSVLHGEGPVCMSFMSSRRLQRGQASLTQVCQVCQVSDGVLVSW